MSFKSKLLAAKQDNDGFAALFHTYRQKIKHFSYFDGEYNEDLESEMCETFFRCVRTFKVDYKPTTK